jgi:hypothetical protein
MAADEHMADAKPAEAIATDATKKVEEEQKPVDVVTQVRS